jgi:predicted SAM-dependent methyltransferase
MGDTKKYVQYGAGNRSVKSWINFDSSPTLRIQKMPILGFFLRSKLNCKFDEDIFYGDIVKGLPIRSESVDGLFCSHILEHLSLDDFSTALKNSFSYLKPGAIFRIIVPDLEIYVNEYRKLLSSKNPDIRSGAAISFLKGTHLGAVHSRSTLSSRLNEALGNNKHQWMWDYPSLKRSLINEGFVNVRKFNISNSEDPMFLLPERKYQFNYALAVECRKPLF